MLEQLLQFVVTGITVGSTYALVGLGFALIYNASQVVNFAQGEFVMLGAMVAVSIVGAGAPLPVAVLGGVAATTLVGIALEKLAIEPARGASVITTIIITIGASILLRGVALLIWGKDIYALPHFSGEEPIAIGSATVLPQSLWVMGVAAVLVLAVRLFFDRTMLGKAVLACACNRTAAQLVGINVQLMLTLSYALSAMLGAVAGVLVAPIAFTSWDAGVMLGLKGFSAAILGGMGNPMGAVAGGLLLGLIESLGAGLLSSGYKDALAFLIILIVLVVRPSGIFGRAAVERV
ncbi:branched-chain amino acid ABC transporter permease [Inmirania thermothiophila]|uniref:Amino acid/amide ABC transporter membrane protein 1 (HAAT family) n=1 Tax=Inmirania thermothiophila TaxID=1750597 RepID=A0A3N1Y4H0_9GAMM|nr:branched-chain amino acid ABC transporter permease [Inmirania thermothiophila]ROR32492.1 amino acid/amide ABC transporter membrane protein 1 (HAAT family) [Inmirania thermothiophila]